MASKHFWKIFSDDCKIKKSINKISVVGAGMVGTAAAFSIFVQGICQELTLVDLDKNRAMGEMIDFQQCQQFLPRCSISAGSDYTLTKNSDIIVITAGVRQKDGESRLGLVQRNLDIFKGIIPELVKNSPNVILVVVSNPVDIMSYVTWKLSGLPRHRVFGTGTMLDTARFRVLLGKKIGTFASSIHGYIIGEHGDSSVAVWSSTNVAGVPIKSWYPNIGEENDPDNFKVIHKDVINSAYEVIKLKGYTSWAIGVTIAELCKAILTDSKKIYPVSVLTKHNKFLKDLPGIDKNIYLSLPCIITRNGTGFVIPINLNDTEKKKLYDSADLMENVITGLKW